MNDSQSATDDGTPNAPQLSNTSVQNTQRNSGTVTDADIPDNSRSELPISQQQGPGYDYGKIKPGNDSTSEQAGEDDHLNTQGLHGPGASGTALIQPTESDNEENTKDMTY